MVGQLYLSTDSYKSTLFYLETVQCNTNYNNNNNNNNNIHENITRFWLAESSAVQV